MIVVGNYGRFVQLKGDLKELDADIEALIQTLIHDGFNLRKYLKAEGEEIIDVCSPKLMDHIKQIETEGEDIEED